MQQPVYATIGSGIVNTAFTVVSVSLAFRWQPRVQFRASEQNGSLLWEPDLMSVTCEAHYSCHSADTDAQGGEKVRALPRSQPVCISSLIASTFHPGTVGLRGIFLSSVPTRPPSFSLVGRSISPTSVCISLYLAIKVSLWAGGSKRHQAENMSFSLPTAVRRGASWTTDPAPHWPGWHGRLCCAHDHRPGLAGEWLPWKAWHKVEWGPGFRHTGHVQGAMAVDYTWI